MNRNYKYKLRLYILSYYCFFCLWMFVNMGCGGINIIYYIDIDIDKEVEFEKVVFKCIFFV